MAPAWLLMTYMQYSLNVFCLACSTGILNTSQHNYGNTSTQWKFWELVLVSSKGRHHPTAPLVASCKPPWSRLRACWHLSSHETLPSEKNECKNQIISAYRLLSKELAPCCNVHGSLSKCPKMYCALNLSQTDLCHFLSFKMQSLVSVWHAGSITWMWIWHGIDLLSQELEVGFKFKIPTHVQYSVLVVLDNTEKQCTLYLWQIS